MAAKVCEQDLTLFSYGIIVGTKMVIHSISKVAVTLSFSGNSSKVYTRNTWIINRYCMWKLGVFSGDAETAPSTNDKDYNYSVKGNVELNHVSI